MVSQVNDPKKKKHIAFRIQDDLKKQIEIEMLHRGCEFSLGMSGHGFGGCRSASGTLYRLLF